MKIRLFRHRYYWHFQVHRFQTYPWAGRYKSRQTRWFGPFPGTVLCCRSHTCIWWFFRRFTLFGVWLTLITRWRIRFLLLTELAFQGCWLRMNRFRTGLLSRQHCIGLAGKIRECFSGQYKPLKWDCIAIVQSDLKKLLSLHRLSSTALLSTCSSSLSFILCCLCFIAVFVIPPLILISMPNLY